MKKLSLFLIGFLSLILVGSNGYASTLFDTIVTINGEDYDIKNRDLLFNPNPGTLMDVDLYNDGIIEGQGILADPANASVAALDNWTGYYLGTSTNKPEGDTETKLVIEGLMSEFLNGTFTVNTSAKVEADATTTDFLTLEYLVKKEQSEYVAGTWSTSSSDELMDVFAVKSANDFSLYYVLPAQATGFWSTVHTLSSNQKKIASISHFIGVLGTPPDPSTDPPPPNTGVVPEPGTMILLGFGLISLAGIGRRKIKK